MCLTTHKGLKYMFYFQIRVTYFTICKQIFINSYNIKIPTCVIFFGGCFLLRMLYYFNKL